MTNRSVSSVRSYYQLVDIFWVSSGFLPTTVVFSVLSVASIILFVFCISINILIMIIFVLTQNCFFLTVCFMTNFYDVVVFFHTFCVKILNSLHDVMFNCQVRSIVCTRYVEDWDKTEPRISPFLKSPVAAFVASVHGEREQSCERI